MRESDDPLAPFLLWDKNVIPLRRPPVSAARLRKEIAWDVLSRRIGSMKRNSGEEVSAPPFGASFTAADIQAAATLLGVELDYVVSFCAACEKAGIDPCLPLSRDDASDRRFMGWWLADASLSRPQAVLDVRSFSPEAGYTPADVERILLLEVGCAVSFLDDAGQITRVITRLPNFSATSGAVAQDKS